MRVLVTRPAEQAQRTAAKLRALRHEPVIAPLLDIRYRENVAVPLEDVQALIFTSSNGVRAFARNSGSRDIAVFAVGQQTAEIARELRFTNIRHSDGDAAALASAVTRWADPRAGTLLHAAGADRAGDIAGALADAGLSVKKVILYQTVAADALPDAAHEVLERRLLDAVLVYSPRSGSVFAHLAAGYDMGRTFAVSISAPAAEPLKLLGFRELRVAARPTEEEMFKSLF